jgi:hypothetical protein
MLKRILIPIAIGGIIAGITYFIIASGEVDATTIVPSRIKLGIPIVVFIAVFGIVQYNFGDKIRKWAM